MAAQSQITYEQNVDAKLLKTPRPAFALAGEIVRTPQHAMRILIAAQVDGREWLIPQARNVHALLRRAVAADGAGQKGGAV